MTSSASDPRSSDPTGAFRAVAYVEAATYLALLAAVVLYRVLDGPDFIGFLGPVHGIAFLVYLALVLRIREGQGWGLWRTLVVVLLAAVPFGGFWAGHDLADEDERAVAAG
jgi:integral membrane protein